METTEESANPFHPDKLAETLALHGLEVPGNLSSPVGQVVTPDTADKEDKETDATKTATPDANSEESPAKEETEEEKRIRLLAGTFKSPEELEKGYEHLRAHSTKQADDLAEARRKLSELESKSAVKEDAPEASVKPGFKEENYGVLLGKNGKEQQSHILRGSYGVDQASNLPFDEYGVPVIPESYWSHPDGRLKAYINLYKEEYDVTDPEVLAHIKAKIAEEKDDWKTQYSFDRDIARRSYEDRNRTAVTGDEKQAGVNIATLDSTVMPKLREDTITNFCKFVPEDKASQIVDALMVAVARRIADDHDGGKMSRTRATSLDRPASIMKEIIADKFASGELPTLIASMTTNSNIPPGNASQGSSKNAATTGGGTAPGKKTDQATVTITRDDEALAKAFKKTPREIAIMRSKGELD